MSNYVGIDLGTTNSVICSYDGEQTRIWKSPEQNDVTPSVIYIDRRNNKYVGKRAYNSASHNPNDAAILFKRFMGTSTTIKFSTMNLTMTPEECSAEILRVLFGYLPEEFRNDPDIGTVITVPAAFNQMQKNATMNAAEIAGIGQVALMQEPVAAIMSVMKTGHRNGLFVIYDLGGGTLDIALAESLDGQTNLLAHEGIPVCGGRDFDRLLVDNVIKPWLMDNFDLPEDLSLNPDYESLWRLVEWAAERAKIELSAREKAIISLSETEVHIHDKSNQEIYVDIEIDRDTLNNLIEEKVDESIEAAQKTLDKAGLNAKEANRLIFIGGPTNYKPLRDKVSLALGIPASTEINPMTAVAEGAALFAESIEWKSENRRRKSNRSKLAAEGEINLTLNYTSRTPKAQAKVGIQIEGDVMPEVECQIDNLDTGWTSGRVPLNENKIISVPLSKNGENKFKVFVFGTGDAPLTIKQDKFVIMRTVATIDAIPASYSIGIEVLEKLGGTPTIEWLVQAGDQLPKKGSRTFKAAESLKAGAPNSLNFKLWEGESDEPEDNRFVGLLKITGNDFEDGVIPAGADLQCDFEMLDSGGIMLEVSVPSIGGRFHSEKNFYSRQEGQMDFNSEATRINEEGERTLHRLKDISNVVDDPQLEKARKKLAASSELESNESDTERAQEAMEGVLEARKLLAQVRKNNLREIRQMDLDDIMRFFNENLRNKARPSEGNTLDNLFKTAQRAIDQNDRGFESYLYELKRQIFEILWRQDWFVIQRFNDMILSPHHFSSSDQFEKLTEEGKNFLENDDIDGLRQVIAQLSQIQIDAGSDSDMIDIANIIRGQS